VFNLANMKNFLDKFKIVPKMIHIDEVLKRNISGKDTQKDYNIYSKGYEQNTYQLDDFILLMLENGIEMTEDLVKKLIRRMYFTQCYFTQLNYPVISIHIEKLFANNKISLSYFDDEYNSTSPIVMQMLNF